MATGPGDGHLVQGQPLGEHRRGAAGQVTTVHQPWSVRPAAPHRSVRQGAGPLLGLLRPHARYVATWTLDTSREGCQHINTRHTSRVHVHIDVHTHLHNHTCTHTEICLTQKHLLM